MSDYPHYLESLNPAQRDAVLATEGPVLIIAGAGAGKTKTVSFRILHLIKTGVAPSNILAITFTNKAAKEMRERTMSLIASDTDATLSGIGGVPFISTFHALGVHILKENAAILGIPRHFGIYDKADAKRAVRDAIIASGLDPKQYEPGKIMNTISREKGNFVTAEGYEERVGQDFWGSIVSEVWKRYEQTLRAEKSLDFDDLLLKTALLLERNTAVLERYHGLWKYIHIDEYQDTNKVQYMIARLLSSEKRNICVVGDSDQCLPPHTAITTPSGTKPISMIRIGDFVTASSGGAEACAETVTKTSRRKYRGELVSIRTVTGEMLELTPHHLVFASLPLDTKIHYVYLMHKREKGFRIGIVQGIRKSGREGGTIENGLLVRCNQEKADKMWVIKVCDSSSEARYWEAWYAFTYGIPLTVFHASGRKIALDQPALDALFRSINTKKRAEKLFKDLDYSFEYPHYFPQGTTGQNTERGRVNVRLTLFSDKRRSIISPWGLSRVSVNTTSVALQDILAQNGYETRPGKRNDWRLEITRLDYGEAERIAYHIQSLIPEATIVRTAHITDQKRMLLQPAANLHRGMKVAIYRDGKIQEDTVEYVGHKYYEGDVYDINVAHVHNYIANGIVVHNCIYGWRGAKIRNILNFEHDFPNATVILLEKNYRSTKTILAAANSVISKNTFRKEKNLFTDNADGDKIVRYEALDELDEARFIARKAKECIAEGMIPSEIAVLYRANFQSRVLEEAFLRQNVPYQVLGVRFFERKEVKDTLSYIKAALDPENLGDLKRVINEPSRGVGKATLAKVLAGQKDSLPAGVRAKIDLFYALLSRIKAVAETESPSELVKFTIRESGLEESFKAGKDEDKERLENIRELASLAAKYDELPQGEGLEKFLVEAALASDQDELKDDFRGVKLMTVHASKGLEFDNVFVAGLEHGLFPSSRSESDTRTEESEEERRLFYVALTRARKRLFLSHAQLRTIFGSRQANIPSEFLYDIDDALIEIEETEENADRASAIERIFTIDF